MSKNFWPAVIAGVLGIPLLMHVNEPTTPSPQTVGVGESLEQSQSFELAAFTRGVEAAGYPASPASVNSSFVTDQVQHLVDPWSNQTAQGLPPVVSDPIAMTWQPSINFADVFRPDVDAGWVKRNWERISVLPSDHNLTAYRCEFSSGRQMTDIHGALTYYFDSAGKLAKIAFRGWTGDPEAFKNFTAENWKLRPKGGNSQRVFVNKSWTAVRGALIVQESPVIRRENSYENYAVFFEVVLPAFRFGISKEMADAVELLQ